jgi:tRNA(Arg) A34 adenosine deaminase TadA
MDHLKRAVELARISFEAGEFPAGAVLVTKNGKVYESTPSLPHNHGEMMVIDMAIAAEGAPLAGATMYASMQSCLMCTAKMYWAGVETVQYVIPKSEVRADYGYEDVSDTATVGLGFFKPITMIHMPEYQQEALEAYVAWENKINGKDS